jgi:ABC-type multidrug transport system ATPase subunit/ABC-type multidrug transport system permease subunit
MEESKDENMQPAMEDEIRDLARVYTSQSHATGELFPITPDSAIDPNCDKFDARKWAKAFYNLRNQDTPLRTSGVAFKNLNVHGFGTPTDFQKTVGNIALDAVSMLKKLAGRKDQRIDILQGVEGVVHAGEMLAVLGPPGSGCSTLLKTIAGDTYGFHLDEHSTINYQGITPDDMKTIFRGEAIYTAEVDAHFPHMTVGDTLYFAARARCPRHLPDNTSRRQYAEHLRDVTMAMFGISHTLNTRVGDDFIRGVSGGERKRVTIAEAALSYSPLQCWDNSTRGLDSANALEFCRTLRVQADILKTTACVSLYQASQAAYDVSELIFLSSASWVASSRKMLTSLLQVFDKVVLLYEGRQIFFGKTSEAKAYFENLGFVCPEQQTTADFLTSMTSHNERIIRPGFEKAAPRSPDEFAERWRDSVLRARLSNEIEQYLADNPFNGAKQQEFLNSRRYDQSGSQRVHSPFMLSYWGQITLTLWRSWRMLLGDPSTVITMILLNLFQALIVSSIFYNLSTDTSHINRRSMVLFFIILMNAMVNILEILTLYSKRRIVEKHARYALYHPSAEAIAHMICDLPYKITNTIMMSVIMYFMTNLRREPGAFFYFVFLIFLIVLTLSMMFRFIGSLTRSIAEALAPASVLLLIVALYSGFILRIRNMQVWLGWLRWLNPIHYAFESLMLNEYVGRKFSCASFIPSGAWYDTVDADMRVCSVVGANPGEDYVSGSRFLELSFEFSASHKWRNVGIVIAFMVFFLICHLFAAEYVASQKSKGEVLVFSRGAMRIRQKVNNGGDIEAQHTGRKTLVADEVSDGSTPGIESQTSVFHWANVCYEVKVKGQTRQILDNVDGWVKPGTLTALMVSLNHSWVRDVMLTPIARAYLAPERPHS